VFVVLEVCLVSLTGIAINVATTKPSERVRLPGPLRPISDNPLVAVVILTTVASLLALRQWQRSKADTAQPGSGGPLAVVLSWPRPVTRDEQALVRQQLLVQVRRTWINGVLERSLAQVARMELGLAEQPDAVAYPWGTLLHQPDQPTHALPPDTPVSAIAGRFDAHLLVLGPPGAGKTTLLLEYARDLLEQAEGDPHAPVPVVFHLSAWPAEPLPLADWLAAELGLRYGVPKRVAAELVERDRLAVLLDGLDEVPADHRIECVQAINTFRADHGGVPLVVCARTRQYHDVAGQLRLRLGGAVEVQPLDRGQVRGWLQAAGRPLAGLRSALRDSRHWLWGLLDSPLWLSTAALTYNHQPARAIRADGSKEVLLAAYVERMLARGSLAAEQEHAGYTRSDTVRWLAWLAKRMGPQSWFYPDWMQPAWLPTRRQQWLVTTGIGLAVVLAIVLAYVLAFALFGGLTDGLASGLRVGLASGQTVGLAVGLAVGTGLGSRIVPVEQLQWSWRTGLSLGLVAGLFLGLVVGLAVGLAAGLGFGLFGLLFVSLGAGFSPRPNLRPTAPFEGIRIAARTALRVGLSAGLAFALFVGLVAGLGFGLVVGLVVGPAIGLAFGLAFGLAYGGTSYLRHRVLCVLLRRDKLIPDDFLGFLNAADRRILLRRAGGGYLFVHRLLQDHFAKPDTQATSGQVTP
jgi:hypothetical protein